MKQTLLKRGCTCSVWLGGVCLSEESPWNSRCCFFPPASKQSSVAEVLEQHLLFLPNLCLGDGSTSTPCLPSLVCQTTTLTLLRCGTAKAQSGPLISFLMLPSARLTLRLPGGEKVHQAYVLSGWGGVSLSEDCLWSAICKLAGAKVLGLWIWDILLGIGKRLQRQVRPRRRRSRKQGDAGAAKDVTQVQSLKEIHVLTFGFFSGQEGRRREEERR